MSLWIPITAGDLNNAKVAALVDALRTAALGDEQTDRGPAIIQGVVDRVRRKIASCRQNQLDSDLTTIPQGLRDDVVKLILADLKNALDYELTDAERTELARINGDLNRIAACIDVVEQPDDAIPSPVQSTAGTPSISDPVAAGLRPARAIAG